MISQKHQKAIAVIAASFKKAKIPWACIGSFNLAVQGVNVAVGDIDVMVTAKDHKKVNAILGKYIVLPMSYKESETFRSYFGIFEIYGVQVECIADLAIRKKSGWEKTGVRISTSVPRDYADTTIHVIPLAEEYKAYKKLGRDKKATLIKKAMNNAQ